MVQPFYCPYCGEQDLRPAEGQGTFVCLVCTRTWRLQYVGTGEER